MGLLLANHVIEQDRRQFDQSFKIDNGDFCKGHHFVIIIDHSGSSQPLVDFIIEWHSTLVRLVIMNLIMDYHT